MSVAAVLVVHRAERPEQAICSLRLALNVANYHQISVICNLVIAIFVESCFKIQ